MTLVSLADVTAGAGVSYASDTDCVGTGQAGHFSAGSRCPELFLVDPSGSSKRVYTFFPYGSFVVLFFGTAADSQDQIRGSAAVDKFSQLVQTWRVGGEGGADRTYTLSEEGAVKRTEVEGKCVVVRPDVVVGYVGDVEGASRYLERALQ